MKRHELIFGILKIPLEFGIVVGAFFLARKIRLVTDLIPGVHLPIHTIDTPTLLNFSLVGAGVFVILFALAGLYEIRMQESKLQEMRDVVQTSIYWFFIYIACLYLSLGFVYTTEIPRLIIGFSLALVIVFVLLERSLLVLLQSILLHRGILERRRILLILRSGEDSLVQEVRDSDIYDIVGYAWAEPFVSDLDISYLGGKREILNLIRTKLVDEILFVHSDLSSEDLQEIFEYARIYGVRYRYVANTFEAAKLNTELSLFGKIPTVEIRSIGLTPWGRIMKRGFDIVFSLLSLVALSPLFLVVAVMIFLQDRHSPIYRSTRVGKDGELFSMYKFRSMRIDADDEKQKLMQKNERTDGPLFKIENDPRITPLGRFIRQFDIDELPQLANVLFGHMSLIGPRPHLPAEVELYKEYQKRVLTLKPGITGMAQSHGRHRNTFDDEVRLDTFYIENWSLLLDLKILIKTVGVVLARKGR